MIDKSCHYALISRAVEPS